MCFYAAEGLTPTVQTGQQVQVGQTIATPRPSPYKRTNSGAAWCAASSRRRRGPPRSVSLLRPSPVGVDMRTEKSQNRISGPPIIWLATATCPTALVGTTSPEPSVDGVVALTYPQVNGVDTTWPSIFRSGLASEAAQANTSVRSQSICHNQSMGADGPPATSEPGGADLEAVEVVTAESVVVDESGDTQTAFDFDDHRRKAVEAYERVRRGYEDCADAVYTVLKTALAVEELKVHTIEPRAKSADSFGRKATIPAEDDPDRPKYDDPLGQITDLAGVRVITYLLKDVEVVNSVVEREFEVVEKSTKSGLLEEEQKLGYQSIHYLVRFSPTRCSLPEYARFMGMVTEVQVRTILQHAWAEIEHDIQYKAVEEIPRSIRSRFTSLAGLMEIADREFQAISDEDQRVRTDARRLVAEGKLDEVEITPDALRVYLDERLGPDGRMRDFSYTYTTRILRRLGFKHLGQVRDALDEYDDDRISRVMWGSRQGQLSRFEDVLLTSMGEGYVERHPSPSARNDSGAWWTPKTRLQKVEEAGITIGSYLPQ